MKKLIQLTVLLMAGTLLTLLAGCSLFASGSSGGNGGDAGDIAFTDTYTFSDPEGLAFDTRYILYDATGSSLASYDYYGCTATNEYYVLYAQEDVLLMEFVVTVFEDGETATRYGEAVDPTGEALVITDNVVCASADQETLSTMLTIYQTSGYISDTTASAFVDFYRNAGMSDYTAG